MNRGIFIFLGVIAILGLAGLYVLQHGPSLFVSRPPTERIAFVSTRGGQTDIWTMKTDGSDKRQITDDAAEDTAPAWSPEANEIVSASNREDQRYEVYVSAWSGKYLKRLTVGAGTKDLPDWGPDGKEIVFLSSGAVHVLPRFGGEDAQIMPTVEQGATNMAPTYASVKWSPNHRTLAAVQDWDTQQAAIVREEFDNPDRAPLPPITAAGSIRIAWSEQDYRVAVAFIDRVSDDGKRTNGILLFDPANVRFESVLVTEDGDPGPGSLAWSPDGKRIAFEMWATSNRRPDRCIGLYAIELRRDKQGNLVESKPVLLAKGAAADPTWSPDGKYVAYTLARKDGKRDIWRVGADGKGAVNLTNGDGDNFQPKWSPASKKR